MEFTQFGQTDLKVSKICFGTWQAGGDWGSVEEADNKAAIRKALELGINFFDTAQAYGFGASEKLLSEALKDELHNSRDKIVIATKGGLRKEGNQVLRDCSSKWLRQGLEDSLRFLNTDYIDIYQMHWPDPHTPFEETAKVLDEFVKEGKIRYVGVSNYDADQMAEFEKTRKIDALQPPYHLFRREIEKDILPYCQEHGIGVLVYGPMAHGLLTGSLTPDWKFSEDDWRSKSKLFQGESFRKNLEVVNKLQKFAEERGHTVAQLAVAWTLANPVVDVAIVGARRPKHIEGTAAAAEFHLPEADLQQIEEIMRGAVPVGGPSPEGM
ncbi:MAG: aldo/keto reductase [Stigonema ocellatum SAG 48.90 = DSM 106950]|nr:aldo/keto reductase [Stigonema ocellatum SAG 48.90 = DSM 106950]